MNPTLFFLDGTVLAPGRVALAAQYNQYADVDASRVLLMLEDGWVKIDFDEDVIKSMSFAKSSGTLYLLGKSGVVYSIGGRGPGFTRALIKGTRKEQKISDPEDRGELSRIRVCGDRVLACGLGGQVFELMRDEWVYIGLQGFALDCPDFEDVALLKDGNVIAVGTEGAVYELRRQRVRKIDVPTNQHLSCVTRQVDACNFACGNAGIVLKICHDEVIELCVDVQPLRNLWAIEYHNGAIYVAEPSRLLSHDGVDWGAENVPGSGNLSFYRLVSFEQELWSFGSEHVFVKRGSTWSRLLIPGNELPP